MRVLAGRLVLEQLVGRLVAEAEEPELAGRLVPEAGELELEPPQEQVKTEAPVLPLAC